MIIIIFVVVVVIIIISLLLLLLLLIIIIIMNINKKREFAKLWTLLSRLTIRVIFKECENKDKYLDLARELKKNYGT